MKDMFFQGIFIPAGLWTSDILTPMEKFLLAEIDSYCGNGEGCFCSDEHFAKLLQVSKRRIHLLLLSLQERDIISIAKRGDKRCLMLNGGREAYYGGFAFGKRVKEVEA